MANRKMSFGYCMREGRLHIVEDEAEVVRMTVASYAAGSSYEALAEWLNDGTRSYHPENRWNKNIVTRILKNEKYTRRVLLQKMVSSGAVQIENDGFMERYFCTGSHETIISDEIFIAVQQEKVMRTKNPKNTIAMNFTF